MASCGFFALWCGVVGTKDKHVYDRPFAPKKVARIMLVEDVAARLHDLAGSVHINRQCICDEGAQHRLLNAKLKPPIVCRARFECCCKIAQVFVIPFVYRQLTLTPPFEYSKSK